MSRRCERNLDPAGLCTTIRALASAEPLFGDVAQLVERLHGMQEVESSNLFVSTYLKRRWY